MNPNSNNNRPEYRGKTIFDSAVGSPMPQEPISPLPRGGSNSHLVTIIIVALLVISALAVAIVSGIKYSSNQAQPSSNTQASNQSTISSQSVANSFVKYAITNDKTSAWQLTAGQFKSNITQSQFSDLLTAFSSTVGNSAVYATTNTLENINVSIASSAQSYPAASYVFAISQSADSTSPILYAQVGVAQINNTWQVYKFNYQDIAITPTVSADGKYSISP